MYDVGLIDHIATRNNLLITLTGKIITKCKTAFIKMTTGNTHQLYSYMYTLFKYQGITYQLNADHEQVKRKQQCGEGVESLKDLQKIRKESRFTKS